LILLVLVGTACAVILITTTGLLTIELVHPEVDTTAGLSTVWEATALILGGVVGYVVARRNGGSGGH
jgi:hypothetical protein